MSIFQEPSVVAYAFDPSTWEAEAVRSPKFKDSLIYRELQDSWGYTGKSSLKNNNRNKHCFKIVVFLSATIQVYKVTGLFPALPDRGPAATG